MYELQKVDKKFPGVHALKAVDFRVNRGEIDVILQSEARITLYPQEGEKCQWVWRRLTALPDWEYHRELCWDHFDHARPGSPIIIEADGLRGDDWTFGLSSTSPDGAESPITSLVPGGEFRPLESEAE